VTLIQYWSGMCAHCSSHAEDAAGPGVFGNNLYQGRLLVGVPLACAMQRREPASWSQELGYRTGLESRCRTDGIVELVWVW
jgi:hypothetical protein